MARQLGVAGFRTLRIDLNGLGDSVGANPAQENDSYAATAFRDIDLALKYCKQQLGAGRIVLVGLCSGAYNAFQAAAQLSNPILVESVLINPLTFFWKEGMTIETSPTRQIISWHYYLTALLQPKKWLGLITGNSHLGVAGAVKRLAQRPRLFNKSPATSALPSYSSNAATTYAHPQTEDLPRDLDRAIASGRNLSLFCSSGDPGHFILMLQAKRKAKQLCRAGRLNVFFVQNADHTFSNDRARSAITQCVSTHLIKRYGDSN